MNEFYGNGPRSNPYRTDQPFFVMEGGSKKPLPAEQIAHQKFTKVAQLNTQYLELVRGRKNTTNSTT